MRTVVQMTNLIKVVIEQLAANRIWIERSAKGSATLKLMQLVRPRAIRRDLVRVGRPSDGGYIVPDDLDDLKIAVSPGVSAEIGFDIEMAERGLAVFMADGSIEEPPLRHNRFHFTRKNLDVFDDERHIRLETICGRFPDHLDGDRILQMDIEGAEYRVLLDTSDEVLKKFRIMVIEFHQLNRLFSEFSSDFIIATFEKLRRFHEVVHIHPNNYHDIFVRGSLAIPSVMEFTLYRKDRAEFDDGARLKFPHPLDVDNSSTRPHIVLPDCWWRVPKSDD
jgi:hypothetical protein